MPTFIPPVGFTVSPSGFAGISPSGIPSGFGFPVHGIPSPATPVAPLAPPPSWTHPLGYVGGAGVTVGSRLSGPPVPVTTPAYASGGVSPLLIAGVVGVGILGVVLIAGGHK
jgi:hypothetical protein